MGSVEYAPIEGFPHYMASSDGKILSKYTGRFLKPRVTQFGYIVAACRGRYRTCMGYRWAYADDSGVA